jgi:PQQ-dependent catabolism-associated beta-propeller protein|tara:strand:+ start:6904 stop:7890 length:987 start_codon:yes stop_codon:yes gene_type:complete
VIDLTKFAKKIIFFVVVVLGFVPVNASEKNYLIISNERSNELTILTHSGDFIRSVETCGRPRGMHLSSTRRSFYVGCADDDLILEYELDTFKVLTRFTNIWAPETFDLSPDGASLYISNEEDAVASVLDIETGEIIATYETGEEPEGVQFTRDGRYVFVASEVANLVHVIDTKSKQVVKDIIVDTRPRRFALNATETELWVSAELSSVINVINLKMLEVIDTIIFDPPGFRKEQVTPVDVLINQKGDTAFVALGRANHIAMIDVKTREISDYILVGSRAWGLALSKDESKLYVANGLSDDMTIIDTKKRKAIRSVKTGEVPYGILVIN